MDVSDDERYLLCGWRDDMRTKVDRQCVVWMLKGNTCSWYNVDSVFLSSVVSLLCPVAGEGKHTMGTCNES